MVETIDWARAEIGDRTFIFRVTLGTWYLLGKWGLTDPVTGAGTYTDLEFAAACAGSFDRKGKWRSEGFARPVDFVDLITELVGPRDTDAAVKAIESAVSEAIKNRRPRQENSPQPAGQMADPTPTDGSVPGPSALPAAV